MATVIFVHGTGTRSPAYDGALAQIADRLGKRIPGITVAPCKWGDTLGYKLNRGGASIPEYNGPGSLGGDDQDETAEARLWGELYHDPLLELRLLQAERAADAATPSAAGAALDRALEQVAIQPSSAVQQAATAGEINAVLERAVRIVRADTAYTAFIASATMPQLQDDAAAVARAVVAASISLRATPDDPPAIVLDAAIRDQVVAALVTDLTTDAPGSLGLFDPLKTFGAKLVSSVATGQLRQRRGQIMDQTLGFIGDILLYQDSGDAIRAMIRDTVLKATPPVTILAHSLGGIATVDTLIANDLHDRVALLATAGSQAPLFYEINALHSLRYAQSTNLPAHMPPWINFYDHQDVLSFLGAPIFNGRVKDVRVDNRQPFPYAHSAYWSNDTMWDALAAAIKAPQSVLR